MMRASPHILQLQGAGMSDDKKSGDSFKVTIGNVSGRSQIAVGKDIVQEQTAGLMPSKSGLRHNKMCPPNIATRILPNRSSLKRM